MIGLLTDGALDVVDILEFLTEGGAMLLGMMLYRPGLLRRHGLDIYYDSERSERRHWTFDREPGCLEVWAGRRYWCICWGPLVTRA